MLIDFFVWEWEIALSNLVCASLTEDPYGVVQKDIEKILEGFIRYLNVLESLEREFGKVVAREKEEVFGGGGEVEEYWTRVERDQVEGLRNGQFSFSLFSLFFENDLKEQTN